MYIRKAKNYTKYINEEKEKIALVILAISTSFSNSCGLCFKYISCFPASLYIATIKESIYESHFFL